MSLAANCHPQPHTEEACWRVTMAVHTTSVKGRGISPTATWMLPVDCPLSEFCLCPGARLNSSTPLFLSSSALAQAFSHRGATACPQDVGGRPAPGSEELAPHPSPLWTRWRGSLFCSAHLREQHGGHGAGQEGTRQLHPLLRGPVLDDRPGYSDLACCQPQTFSSTYNGEMYFLR